VERILKTKHIQYITCTNHTGLNIKNEEIQKVQCSKFDIKSIIINLLSSQKNKLYLTNYFRDISSFYPFQYHKPSFINNLEFNDILIILDSKYKPLFVWEPLRNNLIILKDNKYIKLISKETFKIENFVIDDHEYIYKNFIKNNLLRCDKNKIKVFETYIGSVKSFSDNTVSSLIQNFNLYSVFFETNKDLIEYLKYNNINYKTINDIVYIYYGKELSDDLCMELIYYSIQGGNNNAAYFLIDDVCLNHDDFSNGVLTINDERLLVINNEADISYLINF